MTPRDLLIELERRQSELHKVAASMPVDPYYVRGYQRAVSDLRLCIEAHDARERAESVQLTPGTRMAMADALNEDVPAWARLARRAPAGTTGALWPKDDQTLYLGTVDGPVEIHMGDVLELVDGQITLRARA